MWRKEVLERFCRKALAQEELSSTRLASIRSIRDESGLQDIPAAVIGGISQRMKAEDNLHERGTDTGPGERFASQLWYLTACIERHDFPVTTYHPCEGLRI